MSDKPNYANGLFVHEPHEKAPPFVKMNLSIKPDMFVAWLEGCTPNEAGYIKIVVKESKGGKIYACQDTYQKPGGEDDGIDRVEQPELVTAKNGGGLPF